MPKNKTQKEDNNKEEDKPKKSVCEKNQTRKKGKKTHCSGKKKNMTSQKK